jgi:copper(I)-binding protein
MRELNRLEVAAGEEIRFAPGGLHLMLMQPRSAVVPGDRIGITLLMSDGQRVPGVFDVQSSGESADQGHEHQH